MASKMHPKTYQNQQKINAKRCPKYDTIFSRFCIDFGLVLDPKLGPCWRYVGHKTSKKRLRRQHKKTLKIEGPGICKKMTEIQIWEACGPLKEQKTDYKPDTRRKHALSASAVADIYIYIYIHSSNCPSGQPRHPALACWVRESTNRQPTSQQTKKAKGRKS